MVESFSTCRGEKRGRRGEMGGQRKKKTKNKNKNESNNIAERHKKEPYLGPDPAIRRESIYICM
jgi:hypothetical protein